MTGMTYLINNSHWSALIIELTFVLYFTICMMMDFVDFKNKFALSYIHFPREKPSNSRPPYGSNELSINNITFSFFSFL